MCRLQIRAIPDGALIFIYLSLYAAGRFIISIWSAYQPPALGLIQAQFFSKVALAVSLQVLAVLPLKHRQPTRRSQR